jgi:sugar phosphate isomerase/epimerase
MIVSLSTRWNASRHECGETLLAEIRDLGFTHVELGYDLTPNLVPGVLAEIKAGRIGVTSVHAYCPLPAGLPFASPEPFSLSSSDATIRAAAAHYLQNTIRFAAEVGAGVIVNHAGNVEIRSQTPKLIELCSQGRQFDESFEKIRMKLLLAREKAVAPQLGCLYAGIEKLLPLLEETRRVLAFEILPSWEAIPTEVELEKLVRHFNSPWIRGWHDLGHGQIRENLGLINHARWVTRLQPLLAGMHIHDVRPPASDHLMPPDGALDFALFRDVGRSAIVRVLEPAPATTPAAVVAGLAFLRNAWNLTEDS